MKQPHSINRAFQINTADFCNWISPCCFYTLIIIGFDMVIQPSPPVDGKINMLVIISGHGRRTRQFGLAATLLSVKAKHCN